MKKNAKMMKLKMNPKTGWWWHVPLISAGGEELTEAGRSLNSRLAWSTESKF